MKFILPFALFAATLVTAQDPDCEANYIVETCLESENKKVLAYPKKHQPIIFNPWAWLVPCRATR
jgi:hypothetical protein